MRPPAECPVCGEPVPPKARACPHCGADERSGWNDDDTRYDGVDLPDSAFDEEDPASRSKPLRRGPHPLWWIVAVVLLCLFVALTVGQG
jgi:hypothetical protein